MFSILIFKYFNTFFYRYYIIFRTRGAYAITSFVFMFRNTTLWFWLLFICWRIINTLLLFNITSFCMMFSYFNWLIIYLTLFTIIQLKSSTCNIIITKFLASFFIFFKPLSFLFILCNLIIKCSTLILLMCYIFTWITRCIILCLFIFSTRRSLIYVVI